MKICVLKLQKRIIIIELKVMVNGRAIRQNAKELLQNYKQEYLHLTKIGYWLWIYYIV